MEKIQLQMIVDKLTKLDKQIGYQNYDKKLKKKQKNDS